MKIGELIKLLESYKDSNGDIDVVCINDDGPSGLSELSILEPEYIHYWNSAKFGPCEGPHLLIGSQ